MRLNEYQSQAVRTAKWFSTLIDNLGHAEIGLQTEIGEFATIAKRVAIYGKEFTPEMREHAIEEIGDCYWYCALACEALHVDISGVIDRSNDKMDDIREAAQALGISYSAISVVYSAMREGSIAISDGVPNFMAAIGIMLGVLDAVCVQILNVQPDDVRWRNIEKLRKRYPEKYTDAAAEARADKAGLDARNS